MAAAQSTLLLVEDEPEIRHFLRSSLRSEGYRVVESENGTRAAIDARTQKPDMAIVDLNLPDMDGVQVIRAVREWSRMPILVLSARAHERSKIEALDAGADDYITKPFGVGELFARVRAALRHARSPSGAASLTLGDAVVSFEARSVRRAGKDVRLTPLEFRLLGCLARRLGMVVTHREILTEVWGPSHSEDTHYLRVYMKQLRDKLEADPVRPRYLLTDVGVGYRILADEADLK